MSSQDIDEMLTRVSQIMHQIEQNLISQTEVELIVALFASLTKPESRAAALRSFTRTFETIPPPPPATEPPDAPIVVESEHGPDSNRDAEATKAISVEPVSASKPLSVTFAPRIGVKPSTDTTYGLSGERTNHRPRAGGLHPIGLDEETTRERRIIDVSSFRDPETKGK